MVEFLVLILVVALILAAINHFVFPVPQFVWAILGLIVVVVLIVALLGSADGFDLDVGNGR